MLMKEHTVYCAPVTLGDCLVVNQVFVLITELMLEYSSYRHRKNISFTFSKYHIMF